MTDDLQRRLNEAFAAEHREHVDALRALLSDAGAVGWRPAPEALDEMHRRFHSFKGAARAMDFRPLERAMHGAEDLLARLQAGTLALDGDIAAALEALLDEAEGWVARALAGATPGPLATDALGRWLDTPADDPAPADVAPETLAPAASSGPGVPSPARPLAESVRVEVGLLDTLLSRSSELNAQAELQRGRLRELRTLVDELGGMQRDLERGPRAETVEALRERLGALRGLADTLAGANWHVRRHGARIARLAHETRLVVAESVLFDLARQGRRVARDQGKDVAVQVTGLEVRADRHVLNALKDPLLHLVRNAIVHGIESPADRRAAGKAPQGRVSVALVLRGRALSVRVSDDGRGIDAAAVAARARSLGLVPDDAAAPTDAAALLRLITRPGLSTASAVTELSGRGMGLSIVHEAVRRLGGYVEADSAPGAGSSFVLSVPSVLARRRLIIFTAGGHGYALPLNAVRRMRRAAPEGFVSVEGRRLLRDSDGELAVVALGASPEDAGPVPLIEFALSDGRRFALIVDSLGAIVDRIVEDSGLAGSAAEAIVGCAVVEGKTLVPVLNPVWLATLGPRAAAEAGARPALRPEKPLVLIADDSITTRTLEKSLLEARGYRVRLAVDGREALSVLEQSAVDVVIADVEMPRTDGFALVQAMKSDGRFAAIPVILVTSRDAESDRRKGLALGADAYIVKQRFDERELVETIEQLV